MNDFYNGNGIWIPVEILHSKDLTPSEKILYAEIYYLDRPDTHCYASNEYLAKFLGLSDSGLRKCLSHLKQLGYIETVAFDGRNRVLATTVKWRNQTDTGVAPCSTPEYQSESYKNEFLLYKENKKENSIKKPDEPAIISKNHSKVYKQRNVLEDTLKSGKDIDEQKKASKKSPKDKFKDECFNIIDDVYSENNFSYTVHDLLVEYFEFVSAVPENKDNLCKRVKTARTWKSKLDTLVNLAKDGYDPVDIIQQSLDRKQYVFYPIQSTYDKNKVKSSYIAHNDSNIKGQTLTAEEAKELLAREAEEYGVI